MPFGAFTIPSSRKVLTCRPAFPGGRFPAAAFWLLCRAKYDSNGSRRPTLGSLPGSVFAAVSTGLGLAALEGFLPPAFAAGFAGGLAAGFAAGFAAARVTGFAVFGVPLADAEPAGAEGFAAA